MPQGCDNGVRLCLRCKDDEPSFAGQVERFQSQHTTNATDSRCHRNSGTVQADANVALGGNFVKNRADAATCRIADDVDILCDAEHGLHRSPQRSAVTGHVGIDAELLAAQKDGAAVAANIAGHDDGVAGLRFCARQADTGQTAETLETDNTVRTCEKQLEPGNYTVQVTACSGSYETASPVLSFTVKYRRPVTAPVLEVNGGTYNTSTTITWDDGERAVGYRIRIIREEFCYEFSHLVCPPVGVDSSLDPVYQNDITIVEEDMGMQHSWSGVLTEGFYWVYVTAYNAAGDTAEAYHSLNVRVPLEGDLDDDGKLTQQDAALLEQYLLGDLAFSRYGMTLRADMDGDGRVNGFDLALLRQKIV